MFAKYPTFVLLGFILAACGAAQTAIPEPEPQVAAATLAGQAALQTAAVPGDAVSGTPDSSAGQAGPESTELVFEPIEVTYFTPPQGEGPYYTVDKPADHDNDLIVVAGSAGRPAGQVLEFGGRVYNAAGLPVEGAIIEIWQTDSSGVYLHPNDPATGQRDPYFQFYGESMTATDGSYRFRTILPGKYEPRPIHIHFKVLIAGREVLTSQFYFDGDPALASDGLFASAAGQSEHLIIRLKEGGDGAGNPILLGERDIILDIR